MNERILSHCEEPRCADKRIYQFRDDIFGGDASNTRSNPPPHSDKDWKAAPSARYAEEIRKANLLKKGHPRRGKKKGTGALKSQKPQLSKRQRAKTFFQ